MRDDRVGGHRSGGPHQVGLSDVGPTEFMDSYLWSIGKKRANDGVRILAQTSQCIGIKGEKQISKDEKLGVHDQGWILKETFAAFSGDTGTHWACGLVLGQSSGEELDTWKLSAACGVCNRWE